MGSFLAALQFLTILPIGIRDDAKTLPRAMVYFPIIGLLLGMVLTGANHILELLNFNGLALNAILVVLLTTLTGGLHLDGLADTCDALLSGKDKETMLQIMRDPRIGVMGALSVICVILLKISILSSIDTSVKIVALVLMCILSRWSMVFTVFYFPYARQEGKAKVFTDGMSLKIFIAATIITLTCSIAAGGIKGLIVFGTIALGSYLIDKIISRRFGGITGDTLGAVNELAEIMVLFSIIILTSVIK